MRYTVNIQPVIPLSLTQGTGNLITRTILPVIYAESPLPGGDHRAGLGTSCRAFSHRQKDRQAAAGSRPSALDFLISECHR